MVKVLTDRKISTNSATQDKNIKINSAPPFDPSSTSNTPPTVVKDKEEINKDQEKLENKIIENNSKELDNKKDNNYDASKGPEYDPNVFINTGKTYTKDQLLNCEPPPQEESMFEDVKESNYGPYTGGGDDGLYGDEPKPNYETGGITQNNKSGYKPNTSPTGTQIYNTPYTYQAPPSFPILTISQVKAMLSKKGYQFFDNKINIIGIRSKKTMGFANMDYNDQFNDLLVVIYNNKIWQFSFTTVPGIHYLNYPMNGRDTAILVPDQYIDAWKRGNHCTDKNPSGYPALVQNLKVRCYRDPDKNSRYNFNAPIVMGYFGINIHTSWTKGGPNYVAKRNNYSSAGCQVFPSYADQRFFMSLVNEANQNDYTYTLLVETDFV